MNYLKAFTLIAAACLILSLACAGKDASAGEADIHHPAGSIHIYRFEAVPAVIRQGESTVLVAEFSMGHASIEPHVGPVGHGAPVQVSPWKDTEYTLTVKTGEGRFVRRTVKVAVKPEHSAPYP